MHPPGVLLQLDDEYAPAIAGAAAPIEAEAASRGGEGAAAEAPQTTPLSPEAMGVKRVVAFEATAAEYDRVSLSFSLMAYHLPQRYLAALLAAARSAPLPLHILPAPAPMPPPHCGQGGGEKKEFPASARAAPLPGELSPSYMGMVVSELQFGVRFEHVRCAFDFDSPDEPPLPGEFPGSI
jgi:hypothetical protein